MGAFLLLNRLFSGYMCRFLANVNQSYILQHYPLVGLAGRVVGASACACAWLAGFPRVNGLA